MSEFMKSDAALDRDVNAANTPDEIKELLYRAVERSASLGVTRDPVTGQFVSRQRTEAASAANEPRLFERTVTVGGQNFTFSDYTQEGLETQIRSAREVYEHLEESRAEEPEPTAAEIEAARQRKLFNDTQAQIELQTGQITVAQFLEKTGAVGDYLASEGIDIAQLRDQAQQQETKNYEQSWAQAVEKFLAVDGPGADWPGGKNQKLIETALVALGLSDQPSVESLAKAYDYLKQNGTLFPHEAEVTQADIFRVTEKMAPAEILEIWKQSQPGASYGDGTKANENFIAAFRRK
jgi:hypothetical protein